MHKDVMIAKKVPTFTWKVKLYNIYVIAMGEFYTRLLIKVDGGGKSWKENTIKVYGLHSALCGITDL